MNDFSLFQDDVNALQYAKQIELDRIKNVNELDRIQWKTLHGEFDLELSVLLQNEIPYYPNITWFDTAVVLWH